MIYRKCKLGDIADVISGYAFKTNDFVQDGVGVIKIKNITPPNISNKDMQCVTEGLAENLQKYKVRFNDILISMTGSNVNQFASAVGKVGRLRDKNNYYMLNQRVGKIVIKDNNLYNYDFLYHFLTQTSVKWDLASSAGGSANQANISPKQIKDVNVPLPTIDIQNDIANILNSIDDKIELNNQINENIQSLSQVLYKQWFVDFEFTNEEGLPYKSSGGDMIDSELGMIPKGWEVDKLDNVIELIIDHRGKTPKKLGGDWSKTGIIALSAKIVKNHQLINIDSANRVDYDMYNKWMSVKLKYEDILMTSEAPLGEFYYMGKKCDYCLSQRVFAIRANRNIVHPTYLYRELSGDRGLNQIFARSTGSTVAGIKQSELRVIKIMIPNKKLQLKYHELACEIQNKIQKNTDESYFLNSLRDTLLPKLMNGEINLDNIE